MGFSFPYMVLSLCPGEVYRHLHALAKGLAEDPIQLRLGQPVYDRQHGTDTLQKMAQARMSLR